jgi:Clp amino terminal domain, pathogenicity island component
MFFDRYTEDARRAIAMAKEEAANIGSSHIEAEHLLLGVAGAVEPDLRELLRLKELEGTLRADLRANAQFELRQTPADLPLSNPGKRILAYAAEEAVRLNSPGIGSGHLLLGVLRESESSASRLLIAHDVDLARARQIVGSLQTREDTGKSSRSIGLASRIKRRYWIGIAGQLMLLILLGVVVASSAITGRHLLVIASVWFLAVLAWMKLGPSSFFMSLGRQNRAKTAVIYAFGWFFQIFMFGWLLPLGIGIYRVTVR